MNHHLQSLPLNIYVPDNLSPSLRSQLIRHRKTGKWAYLRNSARGIRRVTYSQLDIMLYGI